MTKLNISSTPASASSVMPKLTRLAAYEAEIEDMGLHAWYSPWNAAYRTDVGGKVSQLTDRSGNSRHLLQATDANRPLVSADYFGAINGQSRDGVAFSGTADLFMETAANLFDGTGVWSYFVFAVASGTAEGCMISNTANERINQQNGTTWRYWSPGVSVSPGGSIVGVPTLFIVTRSYPGSGNMTINVEANYLANGAVVTAANSGTPAGNNPAAGKLRYGLAAPGTQRFAGILAETGVLKGIFSEPQKALLRKTLLQIAYRPVPPVIP